MFKLKPGACFCLVAWVLLRRLAVPLRILACWPVATCLVSLAALAQASELDTVIARENQAAGVKLAPAAVVDDNTFLRRIYVDLIGRIPTEAEIREFTALPESGRREKLVERLLADPRFADRWTIFYADMLRLR